MKILITENQLHKVMFRWLDKNILIGSKPERSAGITFFIKNDETTAAYIPRIERFSIEIKIWNEFDNIFGVDSKVSQQIIQSWARNEFKNPNLYVCQDYLHEDELEGMDDEY